VMGRIEEELSRCRRAKEICALLFIDLDHFKRVNDTWGHRAGDAVLVEAGRRLSSVIRLEDFAGRYCGEEFAVLLVNVDLQAARAVGERLREALEASPCQWQADDTGQVVSIQMSGSIGVAVFPEHSQNSAALIEAADAAMYQAKRGGRNRVCCAGDALSLAQEVLSDERLVEDKMALQALLATIQAFDQDTGSHAIRMMQLAVETATMLGCSDEEQHLLRLAALMHDIGKIGIPQEILHKPGPLTDEEWEIMRRHPSIGRQILAQAGGQCALLSHIVIAHHEHWNGKGYPYGLAHDAIPLGARILSVVDSYDAMTSDRPYRSAMPVEDAIAELERCAGAQFDPQVVSAFLLTLEQREQETILRQEERREIKSDALRNFGDEGGPVAADGVLRGDPDVVAGEAGIGSGLEVAPTQVVGGHRPLDDGVGVPH
ncbi:MAG TPA: diguanylate cyclase, partial [Ktedonobacteraceae bacterium]|nr:diguanylate cyclase [Ktedonobacteraceae bacterium]